MNKYIIISPVTLFSGVIGLTAEQVARRPLAVKRKTAGKYEILSKVQFKAGEVIGLDAVDKATMGSLCPVDSDRPRDLFQGDGA